ncbi:gamma-glutamyl-gamma-aminobutyrate hydrolase family protein [Tepidibacter formicigenes]|uniref:Putative glutamine amidotransferase n=1 Tax=Tepidibacter formicigenes DSM 15518 TaxID=1123349 RepID=A0A1M6JES0_9FIRM|nr:gamma-glutamyl-gamma-aminobutyrate hydrolase family protein [Tepidibacter formicigenes]SHJ45187.1 putative glutamine amidotransferase [Tepidibacter formicigenes DSM 15518]
MKPIIGITTFWENKPRKLYDSVSHNYIKSVYLAGGIPILIPLVEDENTVNSYLNLVDGLILTGGEDVWPLLYGENPNDKIQLICEERDKFEIKLFLKALKLNMPVLGICRGLQVMNVALEGTLYQDINSQIENSLGHYPKDTPVNSLYHEVQIDKESKIFDIFNEEKIRVNSFHHQSIKKLGNSLKEAAWSVDGVIEAVEHINKDFAVGVQWHPEDLTIKYPAFLKLFKALVKECKS